jgi:hypothetical protein
MQSLGNYAGHLLEGTNMAIKVTVDEKRNKLVIEADIQTPAPSKSGKTLIIASTGGNLKTDQKFQGKQVVVGLNVYVPKD